MGDDYAKDRSWADKFIPHMCRIIGPRLLVPSDFTVDANEATDLIVLDAKDKRIACRLRRPSAKRYPYDFTIRYSRPNGVKTEYAKFVDRFGDWMFYGHVSEHEQFIERWMIIDLEAWRMQHDQVPSSRMSNGDGTTFLAYDVRQFAADPPILVASSEKIPFDAKVQLTGVQGALW